MPRSPGRAARRPRRTGGDGGRFLLSLLSSVFRASIFLAPVFRAGVALALLALTPEAAGAGERDPRPDLILVSIDTLRADRLGSYGYARDTSPALDRMAVEGARFARARSHAPWTTPSHMSLFTSLLPSEHGVDHRLGRGGRAIGEGGLRGVRVLPAGVRTLPEILHDAGYHTVAFSSAGPVGAEFGFDRGFDSFTERRRPFQAKVDRVLDLLASHEGAPLFVFVHTFAVHTPYTHTRFADAYLPAAVRRRIEALTPQTSADPDLVRILLANELYDAGTTSDLYDGGIRHADEQVGRILAALRSSGRRAVVLVTSDHGEEFAERTADRFYGAHGHTLHREQLWVPLLLWGAGIPAGRVVETPVQGVDVAPTLLALAGVDPPAAMRGISLLPLLEEDAKGPERIAIAEGVSEGPDRIAIVRGGRKYIGDYTGAREELYDLVLDPDERRSLGGDREGLAAGRRELVAHFARARPGWWVLSFGRGCYFVSGRITTSSRIARVDPADVFDAGVSELDPYTLELALVQSPDTARVVALRCVDPSCGLRIELQRDGEPLEADDFALGARGLRPPAGAVPASLPSADLEVPASGLPSWLRDGARVGVVRLSSSEVASLDRPVALPRSMRKSLQALGYLEPEPRDEPDRAKPREAPPSPPVAPGQLSLTLGGSSARAARADSDALAREALRAGPSLCADLDGDGELDRLARDAAGAAWVTWRFGSDDARSQEWPGDALPAGTLRTRDFDADGRADVYVTGGDGDTPCEWFALEAGVFRRRPCDASQHDPSPSEPASASRPTSVAARPVPSRPR